MGWPTVRAQVAFDTDPLATPTWTTIHEGTTTPRVLSAQCRHGRAFELDAFQPGQLTLELDNTDRRFDPLHAAGPHFGKLLPRKRCRLQADWGTYLDMAGAGGAFTFDVAGFDIVGDIDLRARVAPDDWTPAVGAVFLGKGNIAGQWSYALGFSTAGNLQIAWSTLGTLASLIQVDSTVAVAAADGETMWVRATLDVDDGGGNRVVKFWTSTDDTHDHTQVSWTQLGATVTTAGTTSIHSGSAVPTIGTLEDGTAPFTGKVFSVAVLAGIGGTVVSAPDFTDGNRFTAGATSGTGPNGHVWTVGAPATLEAVTYDLFSGFVDTWPQDYGRFQATAQMTATDGFKVLGRVDVGAAYAEVVRRDGPVGWWRLGDDTPTTDLCSDSSGNGHDGRYLKSPAGVDAIVPGSDDGAVDFDGVNDRAVLDLAAAITTGPLSVEAWVVTSAVPATASTTVFTHDAAASGFRLYVSVTGLVGMSVQDSSGAADVAESSAAVTDGQLHHIVGTFDNDKRPRLYVDGVLVATGTALSLLTISAPNSILIGGADQGRFDGTIDEVALYDVALTADQVAAHYNAGANRWVGDTTGARIGRALDLAGWPTADRDIDTGRSTMGAYGETDTNALAIAQAAEETEGGALWQAPDGRITFRDRHAPIQDWNATVSQATFTDDGTAPDPQHYTTLDLAYDDTLIVNDAEVSWVGGTERSVDQASIDDYTRSAVRIDTGLTTAPEARDRGDWLLARYAQPAVRPEKVVLRPAADARLWRHCLARRVGDRVTVRRLPQNTGDPIEFDAAIESISHRIADGLNTWETEFGLSPTAVDLGWLILDDTTDGLLDTGRLAY